MKIIKSLPLALSVSREERCKVLACFQVVVKMYRYSLEKRVFIVKTYWITGSIKNCQRRFVVTVWWQASTSHLSSRLTDNASGKLLIIFILSYIFVLPTSLLRIPKTHNRTSLQVWHTNVLHFCSFYKPTFSRATREWDALYFSLSDTCSMSCSIQSPFFYRTGNTRI
jgi:hypothetical protein